MLPARTGFVSDPRAPPLITLNPGQVITQNLSLTQPTRTISGRITDLATGNGIAGLQLFIESTTANRITFGFTDAAGNFTASVLADQWKVNLSQVNLSQTGYLRPQSSPRFDTTSANVTGALIPLAKETAVIYGNLKNDTNAPLAGISLRSNDSLNQ